MRVLLSLSNGKFPNFKENKRVAMEMWREVVGSSVDNLSIISRQAERCSEFEWRKRIKIKNIKEKREKKKRE